MVGLFTNTRKTSEERCRRQSAAAEGQASASRQSEADQQDFGTQELRRREARRFRPIPPIQPELGPQMRETLQFYRAAI